VSDNSTLSCGTPPQSLPAQAEVRLQTVERELRERKAALESLRQELKELRNDVEELQESL
jgi:chromosome segregation ATPase